MRDANKLFQNNIQWKHMERCTVVACKHAAATCHKQLLNILSLHRGPYISIKKDGNNRKFW